MSILEAMVRRVLGEKWLVIMILRPASEKDSWWGQASRSSSTISTEGFLSSVTVDTSSQHVLDEGSEGGWPVLEVSHGCTVYLSSAEQL